MTARDRSSGVSEVVARRLEAALKPASCRSLDESFEFEFTRNEMRSAAECAADGSRKYRILYVPFVFQPDRWRVMELPNLMTEQGRRLFTPIGVSATRFKFGIE